MAEPGRPLSKADAKFTAADAGVQVTVLPLRDTSGRPSLEADLASSKASITSSAVSEEDKPGRRRWVTWVRSQFRRDNWRHTVKILAIGQLLSLCITGTTVCSNKLATEYGVSIPTTQSFLNYVLLTLVYLPYTLYRRGFRTWLRVLRRRGWMYLVLAAVDVEGNYFVVKAYQYTSLLSAMLLDTWAVPVVVLLSYFLLRVRYHFVQYAGVVLCLVGMGLLVTADALTDRDYAGSNPLKGDLFCVLGATLYGMSNILEEYSVRQFPVYEVIAHMGLFGTIINGVQLAILERKELAATEWSAYVVGLVLAFDLCLFVMYSVTPYLFRLSSATFFNISLLTSDFYGLLFGIFLFRYRIHVLYPFAFVGIILGMVVYNMRDCPEPELNSRFADSLKVPADIQTADPESEEEAVDQPGRHA
ncbi:hypothetical protein IWQ60_001059 [Tieghemiomyces parasiticus]|uniref:Uncharacterized protein n=1 Tax=Tieghemiomyces parasiticus TaxID=78921 RepID=A0A9W8AEW9_9FUNG|nr:hypothetical protein IWQ60_001059 [Tieghemiomyces parasiticus]